jgi:hypothetical protein
MGNCFTKLRLVRVFRPGLSEQNGQWIWADPLTEGNERSLCVGYNRALVIVRHLPSHNAAEPLPRYMFHSSRVFQSTGL